MILEMSLAFAPKLARRVEFGGAVNQSNSDFDFLKVWRKTVLQRDGSEIPGRGERWRIRVKRERMWFVHAPIYEFAISSRVDSQHWIEQPTLACVASVGI